MAKRTKSRKTTTEITTVVEMSRDEILAAARVPVAGRDNATITCDGDAVGDVTITWTRTVVRDGDAVPVDLDDDEAGE